MGGTRRLRRLFREDEGGRWRQQQRAGCGRNLDAGRPLRREKEADGARLGCWFDLNTSAIGRYIGQYTNILILCGSGMQESWMWRRSWGGNRA